MTLTLLVSIFLPTPTSAEPAATRTWVSEPNGRGTFSLVSSCILTLTICVWTALHLNVPAARSTARSRALERAKWVLYGIFAPEIVVATAAAQYIIARWLKREIDKDAAHRRDADVLSRHKWDMTQCFYAVMGGFVVDRPACGEESGGERVTLTPEGIRLLSFLGKLPEIHESQIQDKSKADWMAKSLVCIQAGWMVAQVVGRGKRSFKPINPDFLKQIAQAADVLWAQCVDRQSYAPYYFTSVPTIGVFLGETDYIVPHVVNFPSMTNLGLGQVNVHRDVLRSVLALTAAAYGGLHLSGWVDYFPTPIELVEAFISLRQAPAGLYDTPELSAFFPHFQ
ncbi:hypothetical protein K4K49_010958 [Colletotrichum sp. SAR 10_70]|nr:hypothetical protein KHU50_009906 [Colletotrichum sp. SAR 10_65]KAI8164530.1 hypothetical protein K4K50_011834 [Colletotrichum sp. SAR 10_71]KAI8193304.1 hypothetical protein K4K49_010958 [Colletotrichum sp. SAR 10_70]